MILPHGIEEIKICISPCPDHCSGGRNIQLHYFDYYAAVLSYRGLFFSLSKPDLPAEIVYFGLLIR